MISMVSCGDDNSSVDSKTTDHGTTPTVSPCDQVLCGGHGKCQVDDEKAVCICDSGYHLSESDAMVCEADKAPENPCQSVDCSGHGTCQTDKSDIAVCKCDKGYRNPANNTAACEEIVCAANEKLNKEQTACECDADNHWEGMAGSCACQKGYVLNSTGDTCEAIVCPTHEAYNPDLDDCACDVANHWTGTHGNCVCADFYVENDGNCVFKASVGSLVRFGKYWQTNSETKDDLEWRILAIDKNKKRMLLITEYVLEARMFNTEREEMTWRESTIRSWLNGYSATENKALADYSSDSFIKTAFTPEEQSHLIVTKVKTPNNPDYGTYGGEDTEDKLFLLSIDEAEKYFKNGTDRTAYATPYAISTGVATCIGKSDCVCKTLNNANYCFAIWWLRNMGYHAYLVTTVYYYNGTITTHGDHEMYTTIGVRPATWVSY